MKPTGQQIRAAAGAIANARGSRRGVSPIGNILDLLPERLRGEVMEDAEAALTAAAGVDAPGAVEREDTGKDRTCRRKR